MDEYDFALPGGIFDEEGFECEEFVFDALFQIYQKKRKQKNEVIISNHLNLVKLVSSNEKFHACIA